MSGRRDSEKRRLNAEQAQAAAEMAAAVRRANARLKAARAAEAAAVTAAIRTPTRPATAPADPSPVRADEGERASVLWLRSKSAAEDALRGWDDASARRYLEQLTGLGLEDGTADKQISALIEQLASAATRWCFTTKALIPYRPPASRPKPKFLKLSREAGPARDEVVECLDSLHEMLAAHRMWVGSRRGGSRSIRHDAMNARL